MQELYQAIAFVVLFLLAVIGLGVAAVACCLALLDTGDEGEK